MAELFLANDTEQRQLVVIKRILPYLSQDGEFIQMFLHEAVIAAQLHHPAIIQVHELGKLEDSIFIAMEYVEGVDFRKILLEEMKAQRVISYPIAAYITAQVCAGLHYAHNRIGLDGKPMNVIHRDVSPQNVMVGYNGLVKLVDFGIAKASALVERSKPGIIKGKFLYLAPEQLSQDRIDHRADIFALGTMLYEVTTGKSPFQKPTTEAVIYAIRAEEPPPPYLVRQDFPAELARIVMKCMAKDRAKRYQQAGEVQRDLEQYLRSEAPTTAQDVARYIAKVFGEEDERTILHVPEEAELGGGRKLGDEDGQPTRPIGKTPGNEPVGRRPTPEMTPAAPVQGREPEPPTQTARPKDLARAFEDRPVTARPPARRPSGIKYPPAGAQADVSTTLPPDESHELLPAPGPGSSIITDRQLPSARARTEANELEPSEPPKRKPLGPEPKTRPARPSLVAAELAEAGDQDTSNYSEVSERGLAGLGSRLWRRPVMLGLVVFAIVLGVGLVVVALTSSRSTPEVVDPPEPGPPPKEPLTVKEPPVEPDPPKEVPDAGLTEPEPPPKDPEPARVTVMFRAPARTVIQDVNERTRFTPGMKYFLSPGVHRIYFRCPRRKGKRLVSGTIPVEIKADGRLQDFTLCR